MVTSWCQIFSPVLQVPPGSQGRKYDSDSERDLDNLLQFHDALQDTLQHMPSNSTKQEPPTYGREKTLRRTSAGEIDSEDDILPWC